VSGVVLEREDVEVINLRLEQGEQGTAIARDFCVSQQTISAIKNGQLWASVTGRPLRISKKPKLHLNEEQVREIDVELRRGVTCRALADRYGVTRSMIYNIKIGKTWGWITGRV
jgi:transposase